MKDLMKQYLDRGVSRRNFLSGLGALGITAAAAKSMASSLAPFLPPAEDVSPKTNPAWLREMKGTGGELLVAQLKAAGVEFIFTNPSTGGAPVFDALLEEPNIHVITALQEGALGGMADGYAKASGKTPFVLCARAGLTNCMTQMYNAWKDQIPMVVAVDYSSTDSRANDSFEDADNMEQIPVAFTKWHWVAESLEGIPAVTRNAFKFASTSPCGPVFVAYAENYLDEEGRALIMDQSKFTVPMKIRPDPAQVEQTARLLLEAQNPMLHVGDEITWCGGQKEAVELAELLGLPVSRDSGNIGWSKAFPTRHPLYVGGLLREMRYPGKVDVMLNLGSRLPYTGARPRLSPATKLIQVRLDPVNLARGYPTEVAIVADAKLAAADLLAAIRSMASPAKLQQIREARAAQTREYTAERRQFFQSIIKDRWDRSPISVERLGMELENFLEKDACFVAEIDSGRTMETYMNFGGDDKEYFGNTGRALGWGLPAAFGVKLAKPDKPVVAVLGDGAFLFSGPQPLWSYARYHAPVTIVVMNNRSYNNERNRIWASGGKQFQRRRDMTCYLGDPDVDFAKTASAFGVEGEVVADPNALRPALERAKRANVEGRPYLLDVHVERTGIGATSTWYPPYSIEALRQRKV